MSCSASELFPEPELPRKIVASSRPGLDDGGCVQHRVARRDERQPEQRADQVHHLVRVRIEVADDGAPPARERDQHARAVLQDVAHAAVVVVALLRAAVRGWTRGSRAPCGEASYVGLADDARRARASAARRAGVRGSRRSTTAASSRGAGCSCARRCGSRGTGGAGWPTRRMVALRPRVIERCQCPRTMWRGVERPRRRRRTPRGGRGSRRTR